MTNHASPILKALNLQPSPALRVATLSKLTLQHIRFFAGSRGPMMLLSAAVSGLLFRQLAAGARPSGRRSARSKSFGSEIRQQPRRGLSAGQALCQRAPRSHAFGWSGVVPIWARKEFSVRGCPRISEFGEAG